MKISVLMAANIAGERIASALASIRTQAHPTWELIVADHGTPDSTEAIVRTFARNVGNPVHYHRIEVGSGAVEARNRLLKLATSDFVTFLDPTENWTPRHLASAVQHFSSTAADLIISDLRVIDRKSARSITDVIPPPALITNPVRTLFARDAIPSGSCVTFRRALAERIGIFDPRFRGGELRDYWLRCALAGAHFAATHQGTCQRIKSPETNAAQRLIAAEQAVMFYDKHRDLAAVPAALRRRLLAASLVAHGRLLQASDPALAARSFWRAWSLQPVYVQTLGQFVLAGWRSANGPGHSAPPPDPRHHDTIENGSTT